MRFCSACGSRFSSDTRYCPIDGTPTIERAEEGPRVDPLIGRVLDGRYRVDRAIGEGGMGIVYLATHVALQKRMALKVLRGDMARDQDVVQRFVQEAQASSAIGHPNIIDISDFGRLPDNSVFFVMEMLEGEPLTDRIARSKGLAVRESVVILEQIASALSSAHAAGIVHRDLKPDNIFLIQRGQPIDALHRPISQPLLHLRHQRFCWRGHIQRQHGHTQLFQLLDQRLTHAALVQGHDHPAGFVERHAGRFTAVERRP